jgi:hypothetical protein
MRHFPALAREFQQSRCAARWRAMGYLMVIVPFLLVLVLAWLRPDFNRSETPDWRPVLARANAAWKKGDLYEAKHLYLQVDQIAAWRQEWEGLIAAACGLKRLDGVRGPAAKTYSILSRAMMAAEAKQSRAGISAVARAFTALGEHKAATMVSSHIQPHWPGAIQEPTDSSAAGCWAADPEAGARLVRGAEQSTNE